MINQLDLDFRRPARVESREEAERILAYLDTHPNWHLARELCAALELPFTENNRRWLRAIAEKSGGQIISGQRGYRHARHATLEENNHFDAWMASQIRAMANRLRHHRRYLHGVIERN